MLSPGWQVLPCYEKGGAEEVLDARAWKCYHDSETTPSLIEVGVCWSKLTHVK